jgi:predicted lipid-binding transport protein (Tim44 family)
MSELNPYESPKSVCTATDMPAASSERSGMARTASEALRLFGFGAIVGASLGIFACGVLSGGRAAGQFYLIYAFFGSVVGVVGSIIGGAIIGIMRLATRATSRCPTTAVCKVAGSDRPATDMTSSDRRDK